jgi:SAM-dependent MidA family methyltransferase
MPDALSPLGHQLREEIAQHGPISFRDFMAQALYDPAHGYYGSGKARVGRSGDFFTNVSVGPLFGRLLARQFSEMWRRLGQPADFVLVEQGAHGGDGAADILAALREDDPVCFAATTLCLVEPVPALKRVQEMKLRDFGPKVFWAKSLAELPAFRGVHYSNELLDAFPVHCVVRRGKCWKERAVDFQDGHFVFVEAEIQSEALRTHLTHLPEVPDGYETEVNLAAATWFGEVAEKLLAGFVFLIDYGYPRAEYYRPERTSGTLSAYAAHQREPDPLQRPGDVDLTAHVDFTSVAETAEQRGFRIAGFTDQHHLMIGLGRLQFPDDEALVAAGPKALRAFKTLMHPTLMGRSFHALCLSKAVPELELAGFHYASDPRRRLFGEWGRVQ